MSTVVFSEITAQRAIRSVVSLLFLWLCLIPASAGDAIYFNLEPLAPLPATLSSLLVQSPILVNVPAGAKLAVSLMKGESVVSTSSLIFTSAYNNDRLIPPVPIASFYPNGSNIPSGQPLPGSTLIPGFTDLDAVAGSPGQYRLLWVLTDGIIATPSRAIATSLPSPFNPIDLKLAAVSAAIRPGDQKPGSVLFLARYTSSASNPAREDSFISLSNTSPTDSVYVRLFLINSGCQPIDYTLCLSARRTTGLLASDLDPGSRGYIMAVACDASGQPIQFNWLSGSVQVKQPNPVNGLPYDVSLSAIAIAKRSGGAVTAAGGKAELAFDDTMYDRLPTQLAADNVQGQANGANNTVITVFRPLPNLAGGSPSATLQVTGYNSTGDQTGATVNASNTCYRDINLPTLKLAPILIRDFIQPGASAWFSITPSDSQPLLGAQFNYGKFSGGHASRPLTFATDYRISVPVAPLTCP